MIKLLFRKIFIYLTILNIILSPQLFGVSFAALPTPSPTPTNNFNDSCNNACSGYLDLKTKSANIQSNCGGPQPGPDDEPGPSVSYNHTIYASTKDCWDALSLQWGQVGQHCDTYSFLNGNSRKLAITSLSLYSAAAAACIVACATSSIPIAGQIATTACTVAGVTTSLFDVSSMLTITAEGKKLTDWWETNAQKGVGATGYALGGAGAVGALGASAAKTMPQGAINTAKAAQGLACASGALFAAAAILKGTNFKLTDNIAAQECTTILKYVSPQAGSVSYSTPPPLPNASLASSGSSQNTQATGGSTGPQKNSATSGQSVTLPSFSSMLNSPATVGALGPLVSNMPNLSQVPDLLAPKALQNMADAFNSGATAGSVISSALPSNIPTEIKNALSKLEDLAKNGKLSMNGLNTDPLSTYKSGGGTKPTESESNNAFGFGRGTASTLKPGAPEETITRNLNKANQKIESDGDIWHSHWNGSIFDVISNKLKIENHRIDQLEWDSPLNRALMGLPKK